MKIATSTFAAIILTLSASVAGAQPADSPRGKGLMARMDTNKDGKISRDEAKAMRRKSFARLDRNSDGVVDEEEVNRARQAIADRATLKEARLSSRLRRLDKDGDGKVSAAEFQSSMGGFDRADRNGDGVISGDEVEALRGMVGRNGPGRAG